MSILGQLLPEPHEDLELSVIVPAKQEAERLETTLQALARQVTGNGEALHPDRWEVLLLINNSTDDSFAVANRFRQSHPSLRLHVTEIHLPGQLANIGHVRKLLLDAASERLLRHPKNSSLMLSTDADTEVAPDWIWQNLAEVRGGAEAVGGRILLQEQDLQRLDEQTRSLQFGHDKYNLLVSWLEHYCDRQAHDPWPRHHQHFGSSFAVKPAVYRQAGGLPAREYLEDVALYEALARQDVRFRHSPAVCVHTAGRLQGRAAVGLAEQLARWREGPSTILVPSISLWLALFSLRKRLRGLWSEVQAGQNAPNSAWARLASDCGCGTEELREALASCWFGTAFERLDIRKKLEAGLLQKEAKQSLGAAIYELESLSQKLNPILRFSELPDAIPLG